VYNRRRISAQPDLPPMTDADSSLPPIRPAERRSLEAARDIPARRILCTTVGRAQAAGELAAERPEATVSCWFLDDYQRQLAALAPAPANLRLACQPDLPEEVVELAVMPFSRGGEAELARELLQQACLRLTVGGTLVAAVDNPKDRWLHEQVRELFERVSVRTFEDGVVYVARKANEPRRIRDFRCEFAFRDRGRLIKAASRPGVFSHRRLDAGARQLMNAAELTKGMHILDIGCGAGTVALALASRDTKVEVHAVDSNARAVECTLAGAELNSLNNVSAELNSTGDYGREGEFDLAVGNPPYYADFRVAELFLRAAHRSLRSGGHLLFVAKQADWYAQHMPRDWRNVAYWPSKDYSIISAKKP
jgi:16S rRNA (guanine1207-N2)-methyltransferase